MIQAPSPPLQTHTHTNVMLFLNFLLLNSKFYLTSREETHRIKLNHRIKVYNYCTELLHVYCIQLKYTIIVCNIQSITSIQLNCLKFDFHLF